MSFDHIVTQGRDVDELETPIATRPEPISSGVSSMPSRVDLCVFEGYAAKRHNESGVIGDLAPRWLALEDVQPDYVWADDLTSSQAVSVGGTGISADDSQKAVDLAHGVMETPSTGPPIRATVDRLVAVHRDHPAKFGANEIDRHIPINFYERLGPSLIGLGPRAMVQPALPYRGPHHPAFPDGLQRLPDGRRIRVFGEWMDRCYLDAVGLNLVGAPVGECQVSISHRPLHGPSPTVSAASEALTVAVGR